MSNILSFCAKPKQWLRIQYKNIFINNIAKQIDLNYDKSLHIDTSNLLFDKKPFNRIKLKKSIEQSSNIFLYSFIDSYKDVISDFFVNKNVCEIGYTNLDKGVFLNFWAICCLDSFKRYTENEVQLNRKNILAYLAYNSKPRLHRQILVSEIIKSGLINSGVVTLGPTKKYLFNNLYEIKIQENKFANYFHIHNNDIHIDENNFKQINDVYTLGNLNVWNSCFLNIISETVDFDFWYQNGCRLYTSEKTYKPLIGMRPFLINGPPCMYEILLKNNFDIFEDLWCGNNLLNSKTNEEQAQKVVNIIKHYAKLTAEEIYELFLTLKPRLANNRKLFYSYAQKEKNKLQDILPHIKKYYDTITKKY